MVIPTEGPSETREDTSSEPIIVESSFTSLANPQYSRQPFIDFQGVNPDTALDALNLNWREQDLPERERTKHVHRLHPYLGKFIPQLAEIFVRKFQPCLVCDPFSGSGTTLVEAACLDVDAFGVDVSPFNCLLTKVKTDIYDLDELETEIFDILHRSDTNPGTLFHNNVDHNLEPSHYLREWFAPQALEELLSYCSLIPDYKNSDVLKVILSRSARSARLVPHHELDFPKQPQRKPYKCRKHRRICRPTQEARKFLERYSKDTLKRIRKYTGLRKSANVKIVCGDSRHTDFPTADLLFTSPPYVGLIDYHEQHRYSYELLGLLPHPFASVSHFSADTTVTESLEIGPAFSGTSKIARKNYSDGITAALEKAITPMPSGGHAVIVVNDKHRLYEHIADKLPVEHIDTLHRHVNRRTGRRKGAFFEEILIWRRV